MRISLELLVSDNASILEHGVQEIDPIFGGNGGLSRQILIGISTSLVRFMAGVHVSHQFRRFYLRTSVSGTGDEKSRNNHSIDCNTFFEG